MYRTSQGVSRIFCPVHSPHHPMRRRCVLAVSEDACVCACELSGFTCVRLCSPKDCSQPGSSVHGIL